MTWLMALTNDCGEPIHETIRDITELVLDACGETEFNRDSTAQMCAAEDVCLHEHGWTLMASAVNGGKDHKVMNGLYWPA